MNNQLNNIPHATVFSLPDSVTCQPGRMDRKILTKTDSVRILLFGFGQGTGLDTHTAPGDALLQILEGTARITLNGENHVLTQGQSLVLPNGSPHSVQAVENFKMLLTIVLPPRE